MFVVRWGLRVASHDSGSGQRESGPKNWDKGVSGQKKFEKHCFILLPATHNNKHYKEDEQKASQHTGHHYHR